MHNPPAQSEVATKDGRPTAAWLEWFQAVFEVCFAQKQSGTTAQRPTKGLWIGRRYFDTTLGIPVWIASIDPVTGADWVDATGASV